jgi:SOS response regulatory protein OraA/RecX
MDRDFANAVINFAVWRDPDRVSKAIADVAGQLQAKGYSAEEIEAAIDELVDELNGQGQPRH